MEQLRQRVQARHPNETIDFTGDVFRANLYINDVRAFKEDNLKEMRVGPLLIRTVSPNARCHAIWLNLETGLLHESREPYSTLSTFRKVNDYGVLFGSYLNCEVLQSRAEYETALSPALNYAKYDAAMKANHVTMGEHDRQSYVRIYKDDHILVRSEEEPEWKKQLHI